MHRIFVRGLKNLVEEQRTGPCVTSRSVSTGTAINRGIRRSRAGRFHEKRARLEQTYEQERKPRRNNVSERFQGSREQQRRDSEDLSYTRPNSRDRFISGQGQSSHQHQTARSEAPLRRSREASIRPRHHGERDMKDRQPNARYGEYRSSFSAFSAPDSRHQIDHFASTRSAGDRYRPPESQTRNHELREHPSRPMRGHIDRDGPASQPQSTYRTYQSSGSYETDVSSPDAQDRPARKSTMPLSLPYTTPASEFLYGKSVILAALKSERRKLYKLYMYDGEAKEVPDQDQTVRKMALARGLIVVNLRRDALRLMDKMSAGRPHNVRTIRRT